MQQLLVTLQARRTLYHTHAHLFCQYLCCWCPLPHSVVWEYNYDVMKQESRVMHGDVMLTSSSPSSSALI